MDSAKLESLDDDQRFYERINDSTTKSVLDFLIDHPEKRYDGAALVKRLGLAEHQDIARLAYAMRQIASSHRH